MIPAGKPKATFLGHERDLELPDFAVAAKIVPRAALPAFLAALERAKAVAWDRLVSSRDPMAVVGVATPSDVLDDNDTISPAEAAHLLGCSEDWVRRNWRNVPGARRPSRKNLSFSRRSVQHYLDAIKVKAQRPEVKDRGEDLR
jgi:hypothetical protein